AVTLSNGTLSGNTAVTDGGGVYNAGALTLTGTILSGNVVTEPGGFAFGGALNNQGTATLSSVTLSGNSAAHGGGLDNYGTATVTNVTLSNSVPSTGTAHNLYLGGGVLKLTNTILTFDPAAGGANCFGAGAPKGYSGGHNLATDTNCGLTSGGDQ